MNIIWKKYINTKKKIIKNRLIPKVRINNHGCVFFPGCNQLIPNFYSYPFIDILLGQKEDGSVSKIGFNFTSECSENSKSFIHTKYVHCITCRPFVKKFFPGIMSNSNISSLNFIVTKESDTLLSITLEDYINQI